MTTSAPRAMFFVDGFNLYHSIERPQKAAPTVAHKWLDLGPRPDKPAFARSRRNPGRSSLLHGLCRPSGTDQSRQGRPAPSLRPRAHCLRGRGAFGHFKPKDAWIESLQAYHRIWQEKATDVSIVSELFRQAHLDTYEVAVVVSGDADYAPAVPVFRELFPQKRLVFGFPFDRKNCELNRLSPESFTFGRESYAANQFPEAVRLPSGKFVVCPRAWRVATSP